MGEDDKQADTLYKKRAAAVKENRGTFCGVLQLRENKTSRYGQIGPGIPRAGADFASLEPAEEKERGTKMCEFGSKEERLHWRFASLFFFGAPPNQRNLPIVRSSRDPFCDAGSRDGMIKFPCAVKYPFEMKSPRLKPCYSSAYMLSISAEYFLFTTILLSFMVGVSSSVSWDHSFSMRRNFRICSTRAQSFMAS